MTMQSGVLGMDEQVALVSSPPLVLGSSDEFEVAWPNAGSDEAKVIPLHSVLGPAHKEVVGAAIFAIPMEAPVAILVDEARPYPAFAEVGPMRWKRARLVDFWPKAVFRWRINVPRLFRRVTIKLEPPIVRGAVVKGAYRVSALREFTRARAVEDRRRRRRPIPAPPFPMCIAPSAGDGALVAVSHRAMGIFGIAGNRSRMILRHLELILSGVTGRAVRAAPSLYFTRTAVQVQP